jgi:peptidoglycan lytic transglycosylase D
LTRFKPSIVLLALLLTGCGTAAKRQAVVQPPAAAPAPKPEPPAAAKPAPAVPAPPAAPSTPASDAITVLVTHAEVLYAAGMKAYEAGKMENARQDFDRALSMLLESNFDIASDDRLNAEFDKLVENIHAVEVATMERGDSLSDQKYTPAPIESLTDLTFPVDPRVKERVQSQMPSVHSDLPLVSNDYVDGVMTYFQGRGRGYMETVLSRVGLYQPIILHALREEGLPQDLIYLAGAESAFNPFALSRAGAKGIWQLMLGRAFEYGLRKNRWVDEREDPVKSSEAAAHHLKDLYQQFGDWYLAMAAYNCGPVTVQKAIERTGYADYWKLRELRALPRETENYVPIILATALIAKTPAAYGFDVTPQPPLEADHVVVSTPTDIRLIAELIDHPVEDLIRLNPSLLRWTTPANDPGFVLNLPAGTAEAYNQGIAMIPPERRIWWRVHTFEQGETLAGIAKKYRVTQAALLRANHIEPDDPVAEGARLLLPLAPGRESSLARVHSRGRRRLYHYRVRRGDTLELIADRFDVTPYEIRRWNNLRSSNLIAGKVLRVYVAGERSGSAAPRRRHHPKSSRRTAAPGKRSSAHARKGAKPSPHHSAAASQAAR